MLAHKLNSYLAFNVARIGGLAQAMGKLPHEAPSQLPSANLDVASDRPDDARALRRGARDGPLPRRPRGDARISRRRSSPRLTEDLSRHDRFARARPLLARRRRHRSAELFVGARRLSRRGRHRQVHLRLRQQALLRQHPPRVLEDRDGHVGRRDRAPHLPRGACALPASRAASSSPASPTCPRTPGSARRAASPSRCSTRSTPTSATSFRVAQLAEEACHIEIDVLNEPIGKQDQYIAAFGSITAFTFGTDGSVEVERLPIRRDARRARIEPRDLLFGRRAAARAVLTEQGKQIASNQRSGRRAHAPDQGARARDATHPRRAATSTPTASSCTSTGRTSASSLEHDRLGHRRALRGRARGRRHRRQADGRGRRRLFHVLHAPGQPAARLHRD